MDPIQVNCFPVPDIIPEVVRCDYRWKFCGKSPEGDQISRKMKLKYSCRSRIVVFKIYETDRGIFLIFVKMTLNGYPVRPSIINELLMRDLELHCGGRVEK